MNFSQFVLQGMKSIHEVYMRLRAAMCIFMSGSVWEKIAHTEPCVVLIYECVRSSHVFCSSPALCIPACTGLEPKPSFHTVSMGIWMLDYKTQSGESGGTRHQNTTVVVFVYIVFHVLFEKQYAYYLNCCVWGCARP